MFDFFRKHTRVLQFLLVLLIFPSFVFFGIQGYSGFADDENNTVAKVAGQKITRNEWENAQREQIDRVRRQMPNIDPKVFDTPDMRSQALDVVIRQRVMLAAADKLNLITTDDRLKRLFAADPQYAALRGPDGYVSKDALAGMGMSSEAFAQRLRQDMTLRQVITGIAGTVVAPAVATATALDAMFQQREVQVQRFDIKEYLDKVNPTDVDIERFYKDPGNALQFQAPEQVAIDYVVLDLDSLKKGISISEDELRKEYAADEKRFTAPEERRASHILIKSEKNAIAADRIKAKAKAEALLVELKKNPATFADVARKNSEDVGSAEKGGDLDFFGRSAMVKQFEDAAFALKPDQISDVVASDFGFHIIKLTGIRGGEKKSFDSVRASIESDIKNQRAQKLFAEAAIDFTNLVYEQSDSLKPVLDKFKLELRTAPNVTRTVAPGASGALANTKFLDALFTSDSVRNKRNTEALEIAPGSLVSGRVRTHTPAHQVPLAEVKVRVRERLVSVQAAALVRKLGESRLAELRAAPATLLIEAPQVVSRASPRELPRSMLDAIMKASVSTLPSFVGVDLGDQGYWVAKITKVLGRDALAADVARGQAQYGQAWADAEVQAYYAALKSRFKVELKSAAVASQDKTASSVSVSRP